MKKQILLLVMMLSMAINVFAVEVKINGLWYEVISKTKEAKVIQYKNNNYYKGDIVIPETIKYEGADYSVTSISKSAFYGCSGLKSVTIPNSVTSIEYATFWYCSGLISIMIPNSVTSIGSWAFIGCSGLISITIPNSVTIIGDHAFQGSSSLPSITIPNSVTTIGEYAFYGCNSLTSVTIPNSVTSIGGSAFGDCSGLTSVTIGNSVTSIGDGAFSGCTGLTSVTIPNSVTNIGMSVYRGCNSLISITIGSGVKSIGSQAFASCSELTDFYCYAEGVPSTNPDAFSNSYIEYATLHVPTASVDAYKVKEPWVGFKTIMSLDGTLPDQPETPKCATPTINYNNGKLTFNCETEGVEYISEITDDDIKKNYTQEVQLNVTYNISVYATKSGHDNSDVVNATLCWIDSEPKTEGITDGVAQILSRAVLIQSEGGILKVEGVDDGTSVSLYTTDGKQLGSAVSHNGAALVGTNIQLGSAAIVKIDEKALKVLIK